MFGLVPWRKEKRGIAPRDADPFALMRRDFDKLFDRFFGTMPLAYVEEWDKPAWDFDIAEEEKEVVVRAEAPGFDLADFDVRVTGDVLTIKAEHKEEKKEKGKEEKEAPRSYVRLERTVTLPAYVDTEKVSAAYRNGVLEIHFPKMPEAEGKKIEVKA